MLMTMLFVCECVQGTALCGLISALLVAVLCITEEDRRYCTKHLRQSETLEKDCETGASIALDPSGTRPSPVYPFLCCLGYFDPFIRLTRTDRNYTLIVGMTLLNYTYYIPYTSSIDGPTEVVNLAKYLGTCYDKAIASQPWLKFTYNDYIRWKSTTQCQAYRRRR